MVYSINGFGDFQNYLSRENRKNHKSDLSQKVSCCLLTRCNYCVSIFLHDG